MLYAYMWLLSGPSKERQTTSLYDFYIIILFWATIKVYGIFASIIFLKRTSDAHFPQVGMIV